MATERIAEYETVEKWRDRSICDLCGQTDDEMEDFGEFRELPLGRKDQHFSTHTSGRDHVARLDITSPAGRARQRIYIQYDGPTADLCPVCFNVLFGDVLAEQEVEDDA